MLQVLLSSFTVKSAGSVTSMRPHLSTASLIEPLNISILALRRMIVLPGFIKSTVKEKKNLMGIKTERKGEGRKRTLIVSSGENDGTRLVTDEALGYPCRADANWCGGVALIDHGIRFQNLGREGVPGRPRLQLIHLREHWLPLRAYRSPLLLRRHGHQNPNPRLQPNTISNMIIITVLQTLIRALQTMGPACMKRRHFRSFHLHHLSSSMSICASSSQSSSGSRAWVAHAAVLGAAIAAAVGAHFYLRRRSSMFRSRVIGIIPARFDSSRFQGKPLAQILGKPMIQKFSAKMGSLHVNGHRKVVPGIYNVTRCTSPLARTWERAKLASTLENVVVATDDVKIAECCRGFGADVVMTSVECRNGTERCSEAVQKLGKDYDIVVNIQGDEPLIEPEIIDGIVKALQSAPDAVFSTAVTSLKPEDSLDPNRSFDSKFLKIYPQIPPTRLQLEEDLEQLKVLENGYKMKVIKVDHDAHGVDTPEDIQKIEALMRERNIQ
ncbi:hypothetical protein ZIOFF_004920 [Zingiber officinale]|uniref:3-deoxy-manno-octulosonate cytidylyltransferase n=1 Tax=Zingiber officinale TaxID=94328 RepID=A0A8J5M168_ZINOF|nr:hypothetical protein ZIOFF_004920 [Zingiber officinale]